MSSSERKITACRAEYWYNEQGYLHREDRPAVEYENGHKEWHINGNLHRLDGPAVKWADGRKEWYVNDKRCSEQEFPVKVIQFLLNCDKEEAEIILKELTHVKL